MRHTLRLSSLFACLVLLWAVPLSMASVMAIAGDHVGGALRWVMWSSGAALCGAGWLAAFSATRQTFAGLVRGGAR